jgi:hypothetical protein
MLRLRALLLATFTATLAGSVTTACATAEELDISDGGLAPTASGGSETDPGTGGISFGPGAGGAPPTAAGGAPPTAAGGAPPTAAGGAPPTAAGGSGQICNGTSCPACLLATPCCKPDQTCGCSLFGLPCG